MALSQSPADRRTPTLLDNDPCFALYEAARAVTNFYRPFLADLGLTYPQYLVMQVLWRCGPMTVKDLGAALSLDSGTLSPLLKRLQASGLVDKYRGQRDGRQVMASSTEVGDALRDRARQVADSAREGLRYSPVETEALIRSLHDLSARLRTHRGQ